MLRARSTSSLVFALLVGALIGAPACTSDGDGAGDGSGGGTADTGSGTADTGGGGGGGGAAAATPCGLAADHEVVFALDDTGWSYQSEASGGRTLWRGTADVAGSAGPIAPSETVSLTLTFDPPLRVDRESGTFNLSFSPVSQGGSELRAVYQQEVASEGTMTVGGDVGGDWGLDASAQAATVSVSTISVNPVVGETLSCLSTRVAFNPVGYDANDNSAVDTQAGGTVSWDGIVIEMFETTEVETEPFGFSFGG